MAERVGFEPTVRIPVQRFSRPEDRSKLRSVVGVTSILGVFGSGIWTYLRARTFGPIFGLAHNGSVFGTPDLSLRVKGGASVKVRQATKIWSSGSGMECELLAATLIKSTDSADYHFATPLPATPGETLGKSVNLIVVATGKGDQLGDEFFQPSGALGKSDGSSGEQVGLGNQARTLVGVGLIGPDVDGLLAETLNETKADRRTLRSEGWRDDICA